MVCLAFDFIPTRNLSFPWSRITQKTTICKSVVIPAPLTKIWEVLANPLLLPQYTEVVSVVILDENRYLARYVLPPSRHNGLKVVTSECKVIKAEFPNRRTVKSIQYDGHSIIFDITLEENNPKNTVFTIEVVLDGKLSDNTVFEAKLERALFMILEPALDTAERESLMRRFSDI